MTKIKWETRRRGTVNTTYGELDISIKKDFKGCDNWSLYIGVTKHLSRPTIGELKEYIDEYVKDWR
jgi:hypothetical protein